MTNPPKTLSNHPPSKFQLENRIKMKQFSFFLLSIFIFIIKSDCIMTAPGTTYNGGRDYPAVPWKTPYQVKLFEI